MPNKPTIALDVSQMVYKGHGVGRYTEELARALLTHESSRFNFVFYAGVLRQRGLLNLRKKQKPWSLARWRLLPLPPKLAGSFWSLTNLPLDLFLPRADLVHLSDWTTPRTRVPSLTTVHDLVFLKYPQTLPPGIVRRQHKRLGRAVSHCAHFLADSENTKYDLMKEYPLNSEQITVVYPGVSDEFSRAKDTKIKQVKNKYHLPDYYLLTLGTREPRKNLPRLFAAHQLLKQQDPSTPDLVVAGRPGWGDQQSDSPHVHYTGFVPQDDLPALLSGASVFVYPSLYEGFGFPVLEAMACATPVVTSKTSSLPEVAGKASVLIDPLSRQAIANGISQALSRQGNLASLGLKRVKQFTWQRAARQTAALYQRVLERIR